jgi:histidine triad (HIT) family protein
MAACLFCAIAAASVPAATVFESERFLAFLDHRPLFPGHCLLIPRRHYPSLTDLPPEETGPLFTHATRLCKAIEDGLGAQGTFVAINNRISQSVPHLHVHVVPRREKDGLKGFFWPRQKYRSDEEMEATREQIQRALNALP